ncbi:MAG: SIMPL domain-containing protein [Chloroflexota bacterium]|jgi:uncharacterized protein
MEKTRFSEALILGLAIGAALIVMGYLISNTTVSLKRADRSVVVKGLSEREVPADVAIWPIVFNEASNDLNDLYASLENKKAQVVEFLVKSGFKNEEISLSAPKISDRLAQEYVDAGKVKYRYSATAIVTVYTGNVTLVRETMRKLADLGRKGIAIGGPEHLARTEFLFTKLNEIKPQMIEEATKNAREVAEKFASDSRSRLGKIKHAEQGLFTISDRDSNTPEIKKVRVVSTVEFYLSD